MFGFRTLLVLCAIGLGGFSAPAKAEVQRYRVGQSTGEARSATIELLSDDLVHVECLWAPSSDAVAPIGTSPMVLRQADSYPGATAPVTEGPTEAPTAITAGRLLRLSHISGWLREGCRVCGVEAGADGGLSSAMAAGTVTLARAKRRLGDGRPWVPMADRGRWGRLGGVTLAGHRTRGLLLPNDPRSSP